MFIRRMFIRTLEGDIDVAMFEGFIVEQESEDIWRLDGFYGLRTRVPKSSTIKRYTSEERAESAKRELYKKIKIEYIEP